MLQTVNNAMKILRLYSIEKQELQIGEIAEELGLSEITTYRLVTTLAKYGYLEKKYRYSGGYQLGISTLKLSGIIKMHWKTYREEVRPILEKLNKALDKTVHFGILEGKNIVYLEKYESSNPIRLTSHIGSNIPAYCTASGLVILAFSNNIIIKSVLPPKLVSFGPNTITSHETLKSKLKGIKQQGYYIAIEETHKGVISIAVPVRDFTNKVIGCNC